MKDYEKSRKNYEQRKNTETMTQTWNTTRKTMLNPVHGC